MVYFVNGTSDFKTAAIQMTVIYHNGKVYTDTGKKVAGNVIHLLPNPEKALR